MNKFFNRILFNPTQILSRFSRQLVSINSVSIKLSDKHAHFGMLMKLQLLQKTADPAFISEAILKEFIQFHKNCLILWTMPTTRLQSPVADCIYPGHNFSSATDEHGTIVCSMSKRPNTQMVLGERIQVPDSRFKNPSRVTKLYSPRYTTVEDELKVWVKRAALVDSPLYIQLFPFDFLTKLDLQSYQSNVDYIKSIGNVYSLFGYRHPGADHYIRASNCNNATEQLVFGICEDKVSAYSCQQAAISIATRMLEGNRSQEGYLNAAEALGLTQGIEAPTISDDVYRVSFTC